VRCSNFRRTSFAPFDNFGKPKKDTPILGRFRIRNTYTALNKFSELPEFFLNQHPKTNALVTGLRSFRQKFNFRKLSSVNLIGTWAQQILVTREAQLVDRMASGSRSAPPKISHGEILSAFLTYFITTTAASLGSDSGGLGGLNTSPRGVSLTRDDLGIFQKIGNYSRFMVVR
jgi:hypothetical protein